MCGVAASSPHAPSSNSSSSPLSRECLRTPPYLPAAPRAAQRRRFSRSLLLLLAPSSSAARSSGLSPHGVSHSDVHSTSSSWCEYLRSPLCRRRFRSGMHAHPVHSRLQPASMILLKLEPRSFVPAGSFLFLHNPLLQPHRSLTGPTPTLRVRAGYQPEKHAKAFQRRDVLILSHSQNLGYTTLTRGSGRTRR